MALILNFQILSWIFELDHTFFLSLSLPFRASHQENQKWSSMEEETKKKEEKGRRKERKLASSFSNPIFCYCLKFEGNFLIYEAPFWWQNNFIACLYKSRYGLWDFWDLWTWFHGRKKLLKMNTNFQPRVSSRNNFCMLILRVLLTFLDKSFFIKVVPLWV